MRPKKEPNCTICGVTSYATGLCRNHYENKRRTGDPLGSRYKLVKTECLEDDCTEVASTKGRCKKHYHLHWYYNRPVRPVNPTHHAAKVEVGYSAAHGRVRAARGHARDYLCACGCGQQATDWALKAGSENRLYGSNNGRPTRTAYSLNPYDYQPMTADCHKRYDADTRNRNYKHDKMIDREAS